MALTTINTCKTSSVEGKDKETLSPRLSIEKTNTHTIILYTRLVYS